MTDQVSSHLPDTRLAPRVKAGNLFGRLVAGICYNESSVSMDVLSEWSVRGTVPTRFPKWLALGILLPLVFVLACGGQEEPAESEDSIALVWEAWREINESDADREGPDPEGVVSSALRSMLDVAGAPLYPFLTDVGRVRGQVPPEVPEPLVDVWRGLVLYQERWPDISTSDLAAAAISGMYEAAEPGGEVELVWEAWRKIDESYANRDGLDLEAMVSSTVRSMLELADAAPYPFLIDVGRLESRSPPEVPQEVIDIWKALVVFQERWPDVEETDLARAAVSGMAEGLRDLSVRFYDAEAYPAEREAHDKRLEGTYLGIGAGVVAQEDQILLFPNLGSPAERAGVQAGDVLLEVEGLPVTGKNLQEVVDQVKGPEMGPRGTKVALLLRRSGEPGPVELEVFRDTIGLPSVSRQLLPGGIGYMYISQFRDNTGDQVFEALEDLKKVDLLALILDLRSNPGGSEKAAGEVAGQFLPPGSLFLYQEDRQGDRREQWIGEDLERLELGDIPMALLVNEATVGEAEALAAVLQDAGRAVVIGTETFGKWGTYSFVELGDGSAIYLPVLRWDTPSGKRLGGTGVEPDIPVDYLPDDQGIGGESQLNRAYDHLDDQLPPFR